MSGTEPTPAETTPDGRPALRLLSTPEPTGEPTPAERARASARLLHPAARRSVETTPAPVRSVPRPVAI